jgi:ABC-type multidrug transport system fused ATPase/permease subunit
VAIVLGGGFATTALVFRKRLAIISAARYQQNRARFHIVQEAFGGIKEVKISGLERLALNRFLVPSNERARHQIAAGMVEAIPSLAMQAILFGGMLLVLLYLLRSQGSLQQALPIVSLYALAGYRLMPAVQRVSEESTKLRAADAVIEALARDLLALQATALPAVPVLPAGATAPRLPLRESLVLDDIVYQYPGTDRPALAGVSLTIPAFHSVGIIGSTGSGKTTMVDVILGLLRPRSGGLVLDGVAIDDDRVPQWQRSLGYVPQQIFLSDETIAANIAFGLPKGRIDMAAVERAARVANLHDFIVADLPQGYDTPVGERGVRLSGGQRQRIGIARALYRDPDILVLDEATSALDNLTEQSVMDAVRDLGRKKTVVMIAHRLSTVRHCDCIYMLERGQLVAQGTYDELLERSEQFRKLALST